MKIKKRTEYTQAEKRTNRLRLRKSNTYPARYEAWRAAYGVFGLNYLKTMDTHLLQHVQLDCQMFIDFVREHVSVSQIAVYGDTLKSSYTSPKSGRTIYVLERTAMYECDAYINDVYQFDADFSAVQARDFLTSIDDKCKPADHRLHGDPGTDPATPCPRCNTYCWGDCVASNE